MGKAWEQGYLKIGVKVTIRTTKKLLLCNESNHNFENDLPLGSIYYNKLTCLLLVPVVRYCLGKGEVFLLLINRLLENIKMEHRTIC